MRRLIFQLKNYFFNANSFVELSFRLHVTILCLLLVHNLIITFYRYYNFPFILTKINFIEIGIYIFSLCLYYFNKKDLSLYFAAFGIPILFSWIIIKFDPNFLSCLWYFMAYMGTYLMLIRHPSLRGFYVIFCFFIFFLPGIIITFDYPENIIKVIQVSILSFIPFLISSFIELQDLKISKLNLELKSRYEEKVELSDKLHQKNQELITFSHMMSHDLKAPLRTIDSFSKLIREKVTFEEDSHQQFFRFIEQSSQSMEMMIDDLLMYYKVDADLDAFEKVDLNKLLQTIKASYQFDLSQGNLVLTFQELPTIEGDRNLLKTLFQNIISNGVKYQPKNIPGHIPQIWIKSDETAEAYFIFIADNGIGINKENLKFLFEPFKRFHNSSAYKGTGLGMSICNKVMDKHNGEIMVQTTSENGTTFKLVFPKKIKLDTVDATKKSDTFAPIHY